MTEILECIQSQLKKIHLMSVENIKIILLRKSTLKWWVAKNKRNTLSTEGE